MPKFHRRRRDRRHFDEPAAPPAPELRVIQGGHQVDELRPAIASTSWRPFGRPPP